ncbi:MAG: hypothetical protein IH627_10390 [Rubrivivax sp.]|nr:hypothetical protein [Rubrivivax sp.]
MPAWTLRLLGQLTIESSQGVRPLLLGRKGGALLACVASHGSAGVPRSRLLCLLWDHTALEDARNALRQCLHLLRTGLGEAAEILSSSADRLVLQEDLCRVDVRQFEALASQTREAELRAAAALYRGEFAEGIEAGTEFGLWAQIERQRLDDLAHGVVAHLSELRLDEAALDEAIRLGCRLHAADRSHEGTARALMRLYARAGLRSKAVEVWIDCRRSLRDELGVEPSEQTGQLAAELMDDGACAEPRNARLGPSAWRSLALSDPDAARRSSEDAQLLDLMLRGWQLFSTYTADGHATARKVYEKVIELAPNHAEAITLLGWTHWFDAISGWSTDPQASERKAAGLAARALDCGGGIAPPHGLMGKVLLWRARHAEALMHLERAATLAPTYAYMQFHMGDALVWCGRPEDSLVYIDRALKLNANDCGVFLTIRGMAQWMMHDAAHARATLESAIRRNPSYPWAHGMLAAVHHEAGDLASARREAHAGHRFNRRFSQHFAEHVMPFLLPEHRERVVEAWRVAGLPNEESARR